MSTAPEAIALVQESTQPAAGRRETNARLRPLFSEYYDSVWRLLRRFGMPPQAADDAAQEVFVILAERLPDVKIGSERSFMYGTAMRLASTWRRKSRRETPSSEGDYQRADIPHADELTDQKRARVILDGILDGMDESLRTAFVLYEIEGLTVPEIAEAAGLPVGTAASRLRRARQAFQGALRRLLPREGKER